MNYLHQIDIYEVEYSVSPGGTDVFEAYNFKGEYIGEFPTLIDATRFCDNMDCKYTVHLLKDYHSS
jgi:hypothetical protein